MKQKGNIRLVNSGELRRSGLPLLIRKGCNELRRIRGRKPVAMTMPENKGDLPLSVIICTMGTCSQLGAAIAAIQNQVCDQAYELLIVWNGDGDPGEGLPKDVAWVVEPKAGLSHARNCGASHAKGEVLLYLDDDAIGEPDLVSVMLQSFRTHKKAAIIGGQIILSLPQPVPEVFLPGQEALWSGYTVSYRRYRKIREQYEFPFGACFAIRREVLQALGGFPGTYGRVGKGYEGGEETALCFAAQQRGWELGIQPKAKVEHRVDPSRFTREHIQKTLRAGILTTYRLFREGYAPYGWDIRYIKQRIEIAEREMERQAEEPLAYFYKQCERDAFLELYAMVKEGEAKQ